MKTAIRPDFVFKEMKSIRANDDQAGKNGASEDERFLYAMTQTRGWAIFKESMDNLYKELNEINKTAIANGASLEEIGRNTVVVSLTQDILDRLSNKVSDAVEACTQDEQ